jgi:hypothetical protein
MATYECAVIATTNTTANTEDVFVEIKAPASTSTLLKRVRIFYRGDATAVGDNNVEGRIITVTTPTAGSGVAGTVVKKRSLSPGTVCTVTVKNGATALALGTGTVVAVEPISFNERGYYDWIPRDDREMIDSGSATHFEIVLKNSAVSRQLSVTVEWEE